MFNHSGKHNLYFSKTVLTLQLENRTDVWVQGQQSMNKIISKVGQKYGFWIINRYKIITKTHSVSH